MRRNFRALTCRSTLAESILADIAGAARPIFELSAGAASGTIGAGAAAAAAMAAWPWAGMSDAPAEAAGRATAAHQPRAPIPVNAAIRAVQAADPIIPPFPPRLLLHEATHRGVDRPRFPISREPLNPDIRLNGPRGY